MKIVGKGHGVLKHGQRQRQAFDTCGKIETFMVFKPILLSLYAFKTM